MLNIRCQMRFTTLKMTLFTGSGINSIENELAYLN